ncbi:glycoside hydrolase family 31 protein [Halobacillus rhizosphaerae]|uniref:glycoside hydrolase family 31 protein n=1 Tax=Halobacillus rhizosphaerae TaxID=3064889 RepID=UPI00398B211F
MIKKETFSYEQKEKNLVEFTSHNNKVHLFILEADMMRIYHAADEEYRMNQTWSIAPGMEDVPFEGRDRFDLTPFTLPEYGVEEVGGTLHISTKLLKAVVHLEGFAIDWYQKKEGHWEKIAGDRKTQSYNFNQQLGDGVFHYMERDSSDLYYGLGEKGGMMNRHHKRYQMRTIDAMGYDAEHTDPLYKFIPFYLVHTSQASYGVYYDNYSDSIFDMGAELDNYHGLYRYYQAKKGDLDYYFILGPAIKDVVTRYTWLTGKTLFPPKWSLGYSGSTMTYTDAPDAQVQLKKFVDSCEEYDIPCDSFQLSSGYTSIGDKRYVFNWNHSKIPDPVELNDYFHENGISVCANIKPVLLDDHPNYEEAKNKGLFIKDQSGELPEISQFWDALGSYLDFTNPLTINWWKTKVKETLLSYGIDSTWNDNNEYEIWDERALAHGFGQRVPVSLIKPIQTLLMMKASYEAQKEHNAEKRPYLISRSGGPGMQRYVQTWSGDNFTEWKTIRYNLKMGLSLSLSGIYNFGHDVGGFAGEAPEPELLIRWIQNGIFHPRFTIHSWNDDQTVNVPWMYPEYMEEIRHWMKERVKWTPYLYHLMYLAHKEDEPILAPTFYHFEEDSHTFVENDEFLVGKDLLVANVMDKGQRERNVYLPKNDYGWYDVNSRKWYEGGQSLTVEASLSTIPLFAQAGAVFPVRSGEISFSSNQQEERGLLIYPPKGNSELAKSFYEDDGVTLSYQDGEQSWIEVQMKTSAEHIEVLVGITGKYEVPFEGIALQFPQTEERTIWVNGVQLRETFSYQVSLIEGGQV